MMSLWDEYSSTMLFLFQAEKNAIESTVRVLLYVVVIQINNFEKLFSVTETLLHTFP